MCYFSTSLYSSLLPGVCVSGSLPVACCCSSASTPVIRSKARHVVAVAPQWVCASLAPGRSSSAPVVDCFHHLWAEKSCLWSLCLLHSLFCWGLFMTCLFSQSGIPQMLIFTPLPPQPPNKEKTELYLTLGCDLPGSCPLDVVKSASRQLQGNLLYGRKDFSVAMIFSLSKTSV